MINKYRFELRIFLSFLKEIGCYEKYKENYFKEFPVPLIRGNKRLTFEEFFYENIYRVIDKSFHWSITDEGLGYWVKIDAEWKKIVIDYDWG